MTKHTPGPWLYWRSERVARFFIDAHDGSLIAEDALEADARLIAAAPDLLASLKEMLEVYGWDDRLRSLNMLERAKAAIAKAEGSSP